MTKIVLEMINSDNKEYDLKKYIDNGREIFFDTMDDRSYNISRMYSDEPLALWFKESDDRWYSIGYVKSLTIEG